MDYTALMLTRIGRRLCETTERARHRLGLPDQSAGTARLSPAFRHPIEESRREYLVSRYRELFSARIPPELEAASRFRAHDFTFLGHRAVHERRIAWMRDPVSGREWSRDFSGDIPYRGPNRLGDIKLPWELSKHQYFFTLGKAAWLTGDRSYAAEIVEQIDDWIATNPYRRGVNWISALEVGARAVSWILAYPFYAACCSDGFRTRLAGSLSQHMRFVETHLSVGPFANNHLIGDAASLVIGGLFLDSRRSSRWIATGLTHLSAEAGRQVEQDGVHVERSVSYHRFVLDQYHLVASLLAANGRTVPAAVLSTMERMTEFLMDVLDADGRSPNFGDGDDARGFCVSADAAADFRSPIALGAVVFRRPDFKTIATTVSEDVFWLYGDEGVRKFEALSTMAPDHLSIAYPSGGYFVMREGWNTGSDILVADCGPLGYGPAAHGHADALAVQVTSQGYPFLVDPGAFSYNLDYAWRDAFRSTRAHNTLVIDDQSQSVAKDRMAWSRPARATARRWLTTSWFDLLDGEHDGYQRLTDPVTHRRVILYLKPGVWVIRDVISASAAHTAELLMHVAPDCEIREPMGEGFILLAPSGPALKGVVYDPHGRVTRPSVLVGTEAERAAWMSPAYGVRVPSRTLSVRTSIMGNSGLTWYLHRDDVEAPLVSANDGLTVSVTGGSTTRLLFYNMRSGRLAAGAPNGFDGELLYYEQSHDAGTCYAERFHRLSIPGLLEVQSEEAIESLTLAAGSCRVRMSNENAALPRNMVLAPPVRVCLENDEDDKRGRYSLRSATLHGNGR